MMQPRDLTVTLGERVRKVRLAPPKVASRQECYEVTLDDRRLHVELHEVDARRRTLVVDGHPHRIHQIDGAQGHLEVMVGGELFVVRVETLLEVRARECSRSAATESRDMRVTAPMPGKVVSVDVTPGQRVDAGAKLLVLEAMKMQNEIRAKAPGKVLIVHVKAGDTIEGGGLLMEIAKIEAEKIQPEDTGGGAATSTGATGAG